MSPPQSRKRVKRKKVVSRSAALKKAPPTDEAVEAPRPKSRDKMTPKEWRNAVDWRLREVVELAGITHGQLAKHVTKPSGEPLGRTAVTQWMNGTSSPSIAQLCQVADFLKGFQHIPENKQSVKYLAVGDDAAPVKVLPEPEDLGYDLVPEVVVQGPDRRHHHKVRLWGLTLDFLRSDLNLVDAKANLVMIKSMEDSQGVEFGDRMLVDCSDRSRVPSPPGRFILWDGFAAVVATISLDPGSDKRAMAKVVTASGERTTSIDRLTIVGRVVGVWKKM